MKKSIVIFLQPSKAEIFLVEEQKILHTLFSQQKSPSTPSLEAAQVKEKILACLKPYPTLPVYYVFASTLHQCQILEAKNLYRWERKSFLKNKMAHQDLRFELKAWAPLTHTRFQILSGSDVYLQDIFLTLELPQFKGATFFVYGLVQEVSRYFRPSAFWILLFETQQEATIIACQEDGILFTRSLRKGLDLLSALSETLSYLQRTVYQDIETISLIHYKQANLPNLTMPQETEYHVLTFQETLFPFSLKSSLPHFLTPPLAAAHSFVSLNKWVSSIGALLCIGLIGSLAFLGHGSYKMRTRLQEMKHQISNLPILPAKERQAQREKVQLLQTLQAIQEGSFEEQFSRFQQVLNEVKAYGQVEGARWERQNNLLSFKLRKKTLTLKKFPKGWQCSPLQEEDFLIKIQGEKERASS